MSKATLTCIECPVGCTVEIEVEGGKVLSVKGNACPRGKAYAENEVVNPKRFLTTTVRTAEGKILSVKTSAPIEKANLWEVMQKINRLRPSGEFEVGDILVENIADGANLVATDNSKFLNGTQDKKF